MRITFWHSDKPREQVLADAFAEGARARGDTVTLRALTPEHEPAPDTDVAVMVGVKSKELFWKHWHSGVHTIYIDKGYTRHTVPGPIKIWEYWRVSVDAHHPTKKMLTRPKPFDRMEKLELELKPWRTKGKHIVFAGSSAKYHDFYGLSDPTEYAEKFIRRSRGYTRREIIYRPKPSWRDAAPIKGSTYSELPETIDDILKGAWCLVTHGSNACFEAMLMGIPSIVFGDAVVKPISSVAMEDLEKPFLANDDTRRQWLANLCYYQWTLGEFASGQAWDHIRQDIYGV